MGTNEFKRKLFVQWCANKKIDYVTITVLDSLLEKYLDGNKDALFGKLQQLINDELYELCAKFTDMFSYVGLNSEFKEWQKQNNKIKIYERSRFV